MRAITLTITAMALIMGMAASAQTAAPPATPAVQPVAAVPEKIICTSQIETGSLVKRHKMCFTAKQWRYVNDAHEAEARKLVEDGTGKPNGN